jgi:hypothetical protein
LTADNRSELEFKEQELQKEYDKNQELLKTTHDELSSLKQQTVSFQNMVNALIQKLSVDFEFWHDVMMRKHEYETKYGKINISQSNNISTSLNTDTNKPINNGGSNILTISKTSEDKYNEIKNRLFPGGGGEKK